MAAVEEGETVAGKPQALTSDRPFTVPSQIDSMAMAVILHFKIRHIDRFFSRRRPDEKLNFEVGTVLRNV